MKEKKLYWKFSSLSYIHNIILSKTGWSLLSVNYFSRMNIDNDTNEGRGDTLYTLKQSYAFLTLINCMTNNCELSAGEVGKDWHCTFLHFSFMFLFFTGSEAPGLSHWYTSTCLLSTLHWLRYGIIFCVKMLVKSNPDMR